MKKDIVIFIDTNIAQSFIKDDVYLSKIGIPSQYYDLVTFIERNSLKEHIEICFPNTVVNEMKSHMIKSFSSINKRLVESICDYKDLFGDLLTIEFQVKISETEYSEYVYALFEEFFSNPRNYCKCVDHPHSDELIDILLNKAITGTKPFFTGGIAGKKHSDAGFKDALIAETIYAYCITTQKVGMFISSDGDFADAFERRLTSKSSYVLVGSIQEAIKQLEDYYETTPPLRLTHEFTENTYWHEYLLNDIGQPYDNSLTEVCVNEVVQQEENLYSVNIHFVVNETKYIFTVLFDSVANDIVDYSYCIEND